MAVTVKSFEDWYEDLRPGRNGEGLDYRGFSPAATQLQRQFEDYKREMNSRTANYHKLLQLADAEVISPKPDLPNVSSGETSGMVLRMARNLVQHTPNVEVSSKFDDDSSKGLFIDYILKSKVIGDDQYSNDMQQLLFASAKNALTLGFDCVIPVLTQDAQNGWHVQYDNIYYRDVFPEPGAKDIRTANDVFVRRYLTKGDIHQLIQSQVAGWDVNALKELCKRNPSPRDPNSTDLQSKKHHTVPSGYEIITYYSSTGDPFLTFCASTKLLLRIEKNKHPLKEHPVFFLVLEKDLNQPLGKSQVERVLGRQEFQDLLLNGAMKMYYRNINPSIIAYGTANATINLSPGKLNQIGNPNAKLEAFEVNSQTLMQYNSIAQANAANMGQQIGAADQQMASQSTGGMMSQTPQGVDAQQELVDITTNNYQKAIEGFFSRYCSYALTIYFHENRSVKKATPSADARRQLLAAGADPASFDPDTGEMEIDFNELATEYFVRTVPGSLIELEDEKQLRILNELFVPLSQAFPAVAAAQDAAALQKMSAAMQFIVQKQLQLSGSMHAQELDQLMKEGPSDAFTFAQSAITALEERLGTTSETTATSLQQMTELVSSQQEQIKLLADAQGELMKKLGVIIDGSTAEPAALEV